MGYIKEPDGVDFIIDSRSATKADLKAISEVIAHYHATGKMITIAELKKLRRTQKKKNTSRTTTKSRLK